MVVSSTFVYYEGGEAIERTEPEQQCLSGSSVSMWWLRYTKIMVRPVTLMHLISPWSGPQQKVISATLVR
jgi:hypothetical protein